MKSRKPVPFYDAARYPDLESHKLERRTFLRSLGTGALVAVCGALLPTSAFAGDPEQPEMQMGGAMPAPDYFTVNIPGTGSASAYLASSQYLTFRIHFTTYDSALMDTVLAHETEVLISVQEALAKLNCENVRRAEDLEKVQGEVAKAIEKYCTDQGASGTIENLVLVVDACEDVSVTPGEAPMEVTHPQIDPQIEP